MPLWPGRGRYGQRKMAANRIGAVLVAVILAMVLVAGPVPARAQERGAVTNLPLPRYVSLKAKEGRARRGPGLTHKIDWVFVRAGMPLMVTAEYENWRRVEDVDGLGGWVHYSLLSGVRTALIQTAMADLLDQPQEGAAIRFRAEAGVIGRLLKCRADWCLLSIQGDKGWLRKTAIWGAELGEILD